MMNPECGNGNRQALLVVGMHRSGTSVLTRLLNLHGVPLGSDIAQSASDNVAGFWENQRVVQFHERLLAELGSSWDDPRELPEDWLVQAREAGCFDALSSLITREFGAAPIWAVKDPRLCRMLPLWLEVLQELGIEPRLIFAMRHPGEVVGSLVERNGLSAATGSMLWLRHLLEPVQVSRSLRRCMIGYNLVLDDWRAGMALIATDLGITWPVPSDRCVRDADAHVQRGLKHQHADARQQLLPETWRAPMLEIHACATRIMQGKAQWDDMETRLQDLLRRFSLAQPLLSDLEPESIHDALQTRLVQAEKDREVYRSEAERLFRENHAAHETVVEVRAESERIQRTLQAEVERIESARAALSNRLEHSEQARAALQTNLAEARGEIVKDQVRIRNLEQVRAERDIILASRSWRWTRPIRVMLRLLRNGGRLSPADREQWRRRMGKAAVSQPTRKVPLPEAATRGQPAVARTPTRPEVRLAAQAEGKRDLFVWAVIDWHFRIQRPQHLARELAAAGHRVFYISENFVDRPGPGFVAEPLDDAGRLFQVKLHLQDNPAIYHAGPDAEASEQLRADVGRLLAWTHSRGCASLVQHPYWLETARLLPDSRLIYDCMDHHGGFADNTDEVLLREHELMREADLLVVTSDWLKTETSRYNPNSLMVRNACQYKHFATRPERVFRDGQGRKILGYYGAIAEWFDLDLLEKVARRHADCLILMVGADTTGAQQRLKHLDNVRFTGEVPYTDLPFYLYGFDVCLLPFQVIPLTLATNPVKMYEYLSAGKEVVSIDLPEIRQFGDLVRVGTDHASFLAELDTALAGVPDASVVERRRNFAAGQTWAHRARDLARGMTNLEEPRVSVVVVTYNNLDLTKTCLDSLDRYSDYSNLEVIVVDNASADDTPAYLKAWERNGDNRRVLLNSDNLGFAAGNNLGLAEATGEYLVMLNNDTHVTPGWVSTMIGHMRREPRLGMLGPVTNNIGNEARIEIGYDGMEEMLDKAFVYTCEHVGQRFSLRTAAFFCVMMPRKVYETVGPLDEDFGIGFFEDDDYCRRVQQAGWSIACAEDVFIHHHLSASFDKLKREKRQALFEKNRKIYEAKWGPWEPHVYRGNDD